MLVDDLIVFLGYFRPKDNSIRINLLKCFVWHRICIDYKSAKADYGIEYLDQFYVIRQSDFI